MKNIKTLIIDSDEYSRIFMSHALRKSGIEYLVILKNGFDVLDKIKNEQFNLILTELSFSSGINGFELIKQVRSISNYKNIPIIVVASVVTRESEKECFEVGVTDFIAKPIFNSIEFIRRIKTHL